MRPNFTDLSSVDKYELPTETYESLPNSVLAWKKNQKLGRFDPNALSPEESLRKQVEKDQSEVATRGVSQQSRDCLASLLSYTYFFLQALPNPDERSSCPRRHHTFAVAQFGLSGPCLPSPSLALVGSWSVTASCLQTCSQFGWVLSWMSPLGRTTGA